MPAKWDPRIQPPVNRDLFIHQLVENGWSVAFATAIANKTCGDGKRKPGPKPKSHSEGATQWIPMNRQKMAS